jgi:hypothetical protein
MKILNEIMGIEQLKIYGFNALAFLSTFTAIDAVLKVALMVASITYTIVKIISIVKNEIKKDK